ncbi:MAG: hypothetical protein WC227_01575 [Patescibacteria group bacterium]
MHTSFPKGTPLYFKFKDGETSTGKFKDKKSGKILLEDGRILNIEDLSLITIRKLKTEVSKSERKITFRI